MVEAHDWVDSLPKSLQRMKNDAELCLSTRHCTRPGISLTKPAVPDVGSLLGIISNLMPAPDHKAAFLNASVGAPT